MNCKKVVSEIRRFATEPVIYAFKAERITFSVISNVRRSFKLQTARTFKNRSELEIVVEYVSNQKIPVSVSLYTSYLYPSLTVLESCPQLFLQ
jgi:accessory gene regulator protein AgrB